MAVQLIALTQLSPTLRKTYDAARNALAKRNYPYAFEMLRNVLLKAPGCLEVRRILRDAQLERLKDKSKAMQRIMVAPALVLTAYVTGPMLLKKEEYAKALDAAEKLMIEEPTHVPILQFLVRVAEEAGLPLLALEVLEFGTKHNPTNYDLLRRRVDLLKQLGRQPEALDVLQEICRIRPNDMQLNRELTQLTASAAMTKNKMESARSFHDLIKDQREAESLEQAERLVLHDEDSLERAIADAEEATQDPKASSGEHRRLADLYRQAKRFEDALHQYDVVIEKTGALDPVIDKAITETIAEQFDDAIEQWRAYAAQNPDQKADAEANIKEIEARRADTLFQRVRDRVERYPNEAEFRYELGLAYSDRDDIDSAMKEFQAAMRNPRFRLRSQVHVGDCMAAKGMHELAIEQYQSALKEVSPNSIQRKEILYSMATTYEKLGRQEDSMNCFKEIYTADINFRDVAERIQKRYRANS